MTPLALFLSQQNSDHTRATYARGIAVFFAFTGKSHETVTDADVIAFKASLSHLSAATQYIRWTACRSYFNWLVRSGRLPHSPFEAVKAPKTIANLSPRIPTDAQYAQLFTRIPLVEDRDWRDRAVLYALGNGLRCAEVVSAKVDDFAYIEQYACFVLRVVGKGEKERLVPFGGGASESVNEWLNRRVSSSDRIFTDGDKAMTVRQVQSAVVRASKRANVKGVTAHSLRHHYATRLIRAGASVFTVKELLGHVSVATTQRYVNLDMSDKVAASRLDPMS